MIPRIATQPFSINNLKLGSIWDANNPNNSTSIPANNAAISNWSDLGVSPNNLSQATGTNQFTYKTSVVSSNNAMLLSGGQYMAGSTESYSANTPISISALVQTSSIAAGSARFLSLKGGSGGYGIGRSGANGLFTLYGVADVTTTSAIYAANTWVVFTVIFTPGTGIQFYANGSLVSTSATSTSQAASVALTLGAESPTVLYWSGYVQFIARSFSVWSTNTRVAVETYLKKRAGL